MWLRSRRPPFPNCGSQCSTSLCRSSPELPDFIVSRPPHSLTACARPNPGIRAEWSAVRRSSPPTPPTSKVTPYRLTSTLAWFSRTNHVFPLTYTWRHVSPLVLRSVGQLRPRETSGIQVSGRINRASSGPILTVQDVDRTYAG